MKIMKMKIESIWQELENDLLQSSGLLLKRYAASVYPDLYVALRCPENLRCIAVNITRANEPDIKQWAHLKDIKVEVLQDEKNNNKKFLLIILLNRIHKDIFSVLCEDLIIQVSEITEETELIKVLLNRLSKWENLFECVGLQGLSAEAQRGLYGELYFLRKFLNSGSKPYPCVNTWLGPSKSVQDFQHGSWAVEVKTTHGNNHQKIHISSERQLDDSIIPEIYLYHLSLDLRVKHGETLNDIVKSLCEYLLNDIPAFHLFNLKLHEAGYFDIHSTLYEEIGYNIRQDNIFTVKDNFPRITETDLLPGVGDVKYSVVISDCQQYLISENKLFTRLICE